MTETRRIDIGTLLEIEDYKPTHIVGGIYQGSDPPHGDALRAAGVDALVLAATGCQHDASKYPGVQVVHAPGDDADCNHIDPVQLRAWHDAARWAAEQARAGRTVLIACQMGWNRSALVTALAVRYLTGWTGDRAASVVKMQRSVAFKSNITFERYVRSLPVPRRAA